MDPNATLKNIDIALKAGDSDTDVDEACDDLRAWIRHGGFEPNWAAYPLAASYYKTRAAQVKRDAEQTITNLFRGLDAPYEVNLPTDTGIHSVYLAMGQKMADPRSTKRFFYGSQHVVLQIHADGAITVMEGCSRE